MAASDPHIPNELPDLRRVGRIAIDSEERDNGLAADRGSSWPWRDGHVCGISVAYRADGQVRGHYFPMRHPDTQNFPPEQVYAWLKDHVASELSFITHNGPFDWGWFRAEAGIRVPSGERLEELGALATLTNENRHGYGLDALARSCGLPGKDERLLKEGCLALDLIANKRKKFRPQNYLWQLPAKYVAPYAVTDAINTLLTYELFDPILDQENTRAAYRLECNLVPLIIEMQLRGIRIDIPAAERARDFLLGKRDAALNQLSDKLGMPVSMDELNQNDWKVEVCDREGVAYPRNEKGNPSFAKDWTEGHPHWLPQLIREAGKYHRVGDLFVDKFILGHIVNGRIHAEIHPFKTEDHGAKSFRFSYSDPPLQLMTARDEELAPIIRGLFLPDEGEIWAKPDASQQEFRIAVHYAALHNMPGAELALQRYHDDPDTDFHLFAALMAGIDRPDAKTFNFGFIYGMGIRTTAKKLGRSLKEAQKIYGQYNRALPFLRALSKAYERIARQQGHITLHNGARRHFNLWVPAGKWSKGAGPCDHEEAERRLADPKHKWSKIKNKQLYRAGIKDALNALIQGTAAIHTKLWMHACWREGVVPLLQMHDCLDCSVATREQAEMVAQLCVEAVELKVPMRCDLKYGRNWGDAKHTWEELHGEAAPAPVSVSVPAATTELEPTPIPEPEPELEIESKIEPKFEPEPAAAQGEEAVMGAYAQCGEILIQRGYAAVPIMLGTKAPGFFCAGLWMPLPAWQRRFLNKIPSERDRKLWSNGETGVGVVGGRASHGLIAFDTDTDDCAIKTALMNVLPKTPVRKVGAKGETAFYYGPDITASRSWTIGGKRICDLIADGRQTVLPPTIHPDGAPYRWLEQPLEAFKPEELPRVSADMLEQIDAVLQTFGWQAEASRPASGDLGDTDDASPHRQLNNFALAHLPRWVPRLRLYKCRPARGGYEAVAHWRESSSGRELEQRARNLSIVPKGIKDFGDGRNGGAGFTYTPLDLVMAASDCDLDTAFKFLSQATGWAGEAWTESPEQATSEPVSEAPIVAKAPAAEKGPATEPAEPEKKTAIDELEPYTHDVPGVVGEVTEWIVATARRPNRVLALAAAIPLVGTLIGRRVAGPTWSATHLYVVIAAPTGAGKQHPIDCIIALLTAADAQAHFGPGSFMSASALCNFISRRPLSLCCADEFGAYLAKLQAKGASGHEREVTKVMRTLWGTSFTIAAMPEWADRIGEQIHSPALSFFGTSTPDELFQALQGEAIENGLLNRFLVLRSNMRCWDTNPQLPTKEVPADLAMRCRQLYHWYGTDAELIDIGRLVPQQVTQLPWADKTAEQQYLDFAHAIDDRIDQDPTLYPFFARTVETAVRLATIRAAGQGFREAKITFEDIRWGTRIAEISARQAYLGAGGVIPTNERIRWINRLLSYVRARNLESKPATVRGFQQHIRCALKAAEVRDMVAQLVQTGYLEQKWRIDLHTEAGGIAHTRAKKHAQR